MTKQREEQIRTDLQSMSKEHIIDTFIKLKKINENLAEIANKYETEHSNDDISDAKWNELLNSIDY